MKGAASMSGVSEKKARPCEIELIGVNRQFKDVKAVDNANIRIGCGEFFSLLGPSGCGKTTTLRMIAGLDTPSSGTILLGGEDVTNVPAYHRNVNTVFQDYAIFPHMNVYENIYYPLRMRKIPRRDAHEKILGILKLVNMEGFEHRYSSQLSGGQRQRIALARALVNEPRALLLDEPLGALDFKLRVAMQSALKELQTKLSMTFVYVTHDQTEAITMSDRIAVMNRGIVHQIGTPDEIYNDPQTAFVASFIGDMNFLEGEVLGTRAGTTRLRVFGREVSCRNKRYEVGKGAKALVCVRPEKLYVNPERTMRNQIEAKLKRVVFRGDEFEIKSAVGDLEIRAVVDHKAWKRLGALRPDLRVGWDTGDAIMFPMVMRSDIISYYK
jgi:spermidine/putrescine transport system ATP-binding protein